MLYQSIIFMGTPDFSVPTLKTLFEEYPDLIRAVITQPDKKKGRGMQESLTPVKECALERNIPVFQPKDKEELTAVVAGLDPDLIVVIAYGMILPKVITDSYFCINVHASILPKYRGASPINAAILNGDTETGITLIKMNEKMDEGDILSINTLSIEDSQTAGSLTTQLSELSSSTLSSFLKNELFPGRFSITPQFEPGATYCGKINKDDLEITTEMDPLIACRKINAYSPSPGAYCIHNGKRIKLLQASFSKNTLHLLRVQPEGKPPMSYKDYLLGNPSGIDLC